MSSLAIQATDLRVIEGDAQPRILDLRIAERLEYARPRVIRELIERNQEELERYGGLPCHTANPGEAGGRPAVEYWLNEAQALLICMRSDGPVAPDIRQELITVFQAWRHGGFAVAPLSMEIMEGLFDRKLVPIHYELQTVNQRITKIDGNVLFLANRVDDIVPRRAFTNETKQSWRFVIQSRYGGQCPCCREETLDPNNTHHDHFLGRELNGPEHGWPICARCNLKLRDVEFKAKKRSHFEVFQDYRREIANSKPTKRKGSKKINTNDQGEMDI